MAPFLEPGRDARSVTTNKRLAFANNLGCQSTQNGLSSRRMKKALLIMAVAIVGFGLLARAAEEKPAAKAKPYPLKTCVVSEEKLGGDMGDPYVFTYEGREVKLCCKSCLKDFNKEPAKYLKKIEAVEKKK